MKKKNNGITLVALVVTIIVLLILAAISLNLVLGENGVITRAREASVKTKEDQKREGINLDDLESEIGQVGGVTKITDRNPGTISGAGSEEDPYLIESIEDLVKLQKDVEGGNLYDGKTVKLTTSLDFNSELSYADVNSTSFGDINGDGTTEGIQKELTTSKGWMPIGKSNVNFKANFDGNKKQLLNLYMNRNSNERQVNVGGDVEASYGLFAAPNGVISNLYISGNIKIDLKGLTNASVVDVSTLGYNDRIGGKASNIISDVNVEMVQTEASTASPLCYVCGIMATVENIESCINNGNVSLTLNNPNGNTTAYVAGVTANVFKSASNVVNNGKVSAININKGLVGGTFSNISTDSLVENITNNGNINNVIRLNNVDATESVALGGITALNYKGSMNKVKNTGKIEITRLVETDADDKSDQFSIAAINGESISGKITNAINEGDIVYNSESKKKTYLGAICGIAYPRDDGKKFVINNVINRGNINVNDTCTSTINNHYMNCGSVLGRVSVWIANNENCSIKNAYNEGNLKVNYGIDNEVRLGGIFGRNTVTQYVKIDTKNLMDKGDLSIPDSQVIRRGFVTACDAEFNSINGTFIDNNLSYSGTKGCSNPAETTATRMDMTADNVANQMNSGLEEGYCRWKNDNGKVSLEF